MSDPERRAFKDYFDAEAAAALADLFSASPRRFDRGAFMAEALDGVEALEMMDRVRRWSAALRRQLPGRTEEMLAAIVASLPPPLDSTDAITHGFVLWPVGQLIADHATDAPEAALDAMVELTQRFTSEFAVRPFVARHPELTFARLSALTAHPSPHVRRWCSEGVRPRLPWGARLDALVRDPSPIFPILEALRDDDSAYVRRSVANNLNDIAKDHPQRVVSVGRRWWKGASPERQRVVRHGLRTLIKAGDPGALAILGYSAPAKLEASLKIAPRDISIGDEIELTLTLRNAGDRPLSLLVDYRVHFVKASGEARPKVFKWKELRLEAGAREVLRRRQSMKHATIRRLHPGRHVVDVMVNGHPSCENHFRLRA